MKVFYDEGLANHIDLEPCGCAREGAGEASVEERAGRPLSRESFTPGCRHRGSGGRQHEDARHRECVPDSAWS